MNVQFNVHISAWKKYFAVEKNEFDMDPNVQESFFGEKNENVWLKSAAETSHPPPKPGLKQKNY